MVANFLFVLFLLVCSTEASQYKVFNVQNYGANADGNTDNSVVINHVNSFSRVFYIFSYNYKFIYFLTNYNFCFDGLTYNLLFSYIYIKAFLKAWSDACEWKGKSTILIPQGTYMLKEVMFSGPCNAWMNFKIEGILKAPSDPYSFKTDNWINFRYIDKLKVGGGGTLDGQGSTAWKTNDCQKNPNCRTLPTVSSFHII
jgi:hypothetical protein